MLLIGVITIATVLLFSCDTALSKTEQVNKDAANALYTLTERCTLYNCPNNWPPRSAGVTSCYIYFHQSKEWSDAEKSCRDNGGQLVKFDTLGEITTVKNFLQSYYGISSMPWMWTGLNDRSSEGRYQWTGFGGELSKGSSMWSGGQPDNHSPWWSFWDDEDCVEFNGRQLNDQDCDEGRPYVCEFIP
ncbi:C-type lectin domain family 4 member M [Strongylocentrotus purpuratus]|uniref:C-type lectin domain-containing protein n=1 Tax=Strongylocentrotus purpuratus TaxID=7668 RepID=A0A7M7T4K4_STRPU|nr:C-type lectin domain family 4 member M [Strongylocentrotus purpuratus]